MYKQFQPLEMVRKAFYSRTPWYVILYVTAHCNSRCKFCFYWEEISAADRTKELTLEELEKISLHLPHIYQLTLTGGEPFMRPHLERIIALFYQNSDVSRFTIPTNGYFSRGMEEVLEAALRECPEASISVNFSLDNLGEAHDEVRGLPGNFNRMLETIARLRRMQKRYSNLFLGAATTASAFNIDDLRKIIDFVYDHDLVDNYGIMLARGNVMEAESKNFPLEKYWEAVRYHTQRIASRSSNRILLQTLYETKKQAVREKRQVDVCKAGEKLVVISERGRVYPCELLPPFVTPGGDHYSQVEGIEDFSFGNLRDFDYDLPQMLETEHARRVQDYIQKGRCWCTFECALINNLFFSPRAYLHLARNALLPGEAAKV